MNFIRQFTESTFAKPSTSSSEAKSREGTSNESSTENDEFPSVSFRCSDCPKIEKFARDENINEMFDDMWNQFSETIPFIDENLSFDPPMIMSRTSMSYLRNFLATYTKHRNLKPFKSSSEVNLLNNISNEEEAADSLEAIIGRTEDRNSDGKELHSPGINYLSSFNWIGSSDSGTAESNETGYPFKAIYGCAFALKSVSYMLSNDNIAHGLSAADINAYWDLYDWLIRHFQGLSRSRGNLHYFWQHEVLKEIHGSLHWIWATLKRSWELESVKLASDPARSSYHSSLQLRVLILQSCVDILQNCVDPFSYWKSFLSTFSLDDEYYLKRPETEFLRIHSALLSDFILIFKDTISFLFHFQSQNWTCLNVDEQCQDEISLVRLLHRKMKDEQTLLAQLLNLVGSTFLIHRDAKFLETELFSDSGVAVQITNLIGGFSLEKFPQGSMIESQFRAEYRFQLLACHFVMLASLKLNLIKFMPKLRDSFKVGIRNFAIWINKVHFLSSNGFLSDEESYAGINSFPFVRSLRSIVCLSRAFSNFKDSKAKVDGKRIDNPIYEVVSQSKHFRSLLSVELDCLFSLLISYVYLDFHQNGENASLDLLSLVIDVICESFMKADMDLGSQQKLIFYLYGLLSLFQVISLEPFGEDNAVLKHKIYDLLSKKQYFWDYVYLIFNEIDSEAQFDKNEARIEIAVRNFCLETSKELLNMFYASGSRLLIEKSITLLLKIFMKTRGSSKKEVIIRFFGSVLERYANNPSFASSFAELGGPYLILNYMENHDEKDKVFDHLSFLFNQELVNTSLFQDGYIFLDQKFIELILSALFNKSLENETIYFIPLKNMITKFNSIETSSSSREKVHNFAKSLGQKIIPLQKEQKLDTAVLERTFRIFDAIVDSILSPSGTKALQNFFKVLEFRQSLLYYISLVLDSRIDKKYVENILKYLHAFLLGNQHNSFLFDKMMGYEYLKDMLKFNAQMSGISFDRLWCIVLNISKEDLSREKENMVSNPYVLCCLVSSLSYMSENQRMFTLSNIYKFLERNYFNLAQLSRQPLQRLLLEDFVNSKSDEKIRIKNIIVMLMKFNTKSTDIYALFSSIKKLRNASSLSDFAALLDICVDSADGAEKHVSSSFLLSDSKSSISAECSKNLFSESGYSIGFWVNFGKYEGKISGRQYIFNFFDSEPNHGMSIFSEYDHLYLEILRESSSILIDLDAEITYSTWHMFAISYKSLKKIGISRKPKISIFLDGKCIHKVRSEVLKPFYFSDFSIGTNPNRSMNNITAMSCMKWEVKWIFGSKIPFITKDALFFYQKGPDAIINEIGQFPFNYKRSLVLIVHPNSVNESFTEASNCSIDLTVHGIPANPAKLNYVLVTHRKSFSDSLKSVGGVPVILGLMKQIDEISQNAESEADLNLCSLCISQTFNLIASVLKNNDTNVLDASKFEFMGVIGLMLRKMSFLLSPEVVDSIYHLYEVCKGGLMAEIIEVSLIFELRIWKKTNSETQLRYFERLESLVHGNIDYFYSKKGIYWMLDWIGKICDSSAGPESASFRAIYSILKFTISRYVTPADFDMFFGFLASRVSDLVLLREMLLILVDVFDDEVSEQLLNSFKIACGSNFEKLCFLASSQKDEFGLLILGVLGKLCRSSTKFTAYLDNSNASIWIRELLVQCFSEDLVTEFMELSIESFSLNTPSKIKFKSIFKMSFHAFVCQNKISFTALYNKYAKVLNIIEYEQNWKPLSEFMTWLLPSSAAMAAAYEISLDSQKEFPHFFIRTLVYVFIKKFMFQENAFEDFYVVIVAIWTLNYRKSTLLGLIQIFMINLLSAICEKSRPFISDIEKNNILGFMGILEELVFGHAELYNVARKAMRKSSLSKKALLETSSSSSLDVFTPQSCSWESVNLFRKVYEVIKLRKISLRSKLPGDDEETRPGGVFRLLMRLGLWALMSPDSEISCYAALNLRAIFNDYSPDSRGHISEIHSDFFKTNTKRKIFFVLASIYQAFVSSKSLDKSASTEIGTLLHFLVNRWRSYLVELQQSLSGRGLEPELRSYNILDSNYFDFLNGDEFLSASKVQEEESTDWLQKSVKKFQGIFDRTFQSSQRESSKSKESHDAMMRDEIKWITASSDRLKALYSSQQAKEAKDEETCFYAWKQISKILYHPAGPWSSHRCSELKWILDSKQDPLGCRRILAVNYRFNDHQEASLKRDKSQHNSSAENNELEFAYKTYDEFHNILQQKVSDLDIEDDIESMQKEEEDWDLLVDEGEKLTDFNTDRFLFSCPCKSVFLMSVIDGKLELTSQTISLIYEIKFDDENLFDSAARLANPNFGKNVKMNIDEITEIHARRFLLQRNGIEIFFTNGTTIFLVFSKKDRNKFCSRLMHLNPPKLKRWVLSPKLYLSKSGLTEAWMSGKISNFDYLMALNTLSGRTFNDLTQYPVFPWILIDYNSEKLDLENPKIYRDLSKPIGALNEDRLKHFLDRYHSFPESAEIPKFHYGTHYSTAAGVLFYLIRLEPFTSLHIALQNGKFDHSDRQFHSINSAWRSCMENTGDVKELIPEFFFFSEFLENQNNFDLGKRQTGDIIKDVKLPPWADGNFEKFIQLQREALESDYVSSNLHQWIDLIFGFKQRGEEASRANNVFFHLTYEGAVKLENVMDESEKKSIESQINNFGQTPYQLFQKPHPKRKWRMSGKVTPPIADAPKVKNFVVPTKIPNIAHAESQYLNENTYRWSILSEGTLETYIVLLNPGNIEVPFTIEREDVMREKIYSLEDWNKSLKYSFTSDGKFIFITGFWNYRIRIHSALNGNLIHEFLGHDSVPTCCSISHNSAVFVVGYSDSVIQCYSTKWRTSVSGLVSDLSGRLSSVKICGNIMLCGHNNEIVQVEVHSDNDTLVSCSKDHKIITWSITEGRAIRVIDIMDNLVQTNYRHSRSVYYDEFTLIGLKISPNTANIHTLIRYENYQGKVQTYLQTFTINGNNIFMQEIPGKPFKFLLINPSTVSASNDKLMILNDDGSVLLVGQSNSENFLLRKMETSVPIKWPFVVKSGLGVGGIRQDGSFCLFWPV